MNDAHTLPDRVVALLRAVARSMGGAEGERLSSQVARSRATSYSPTYIDIEVSDGAHAGDWTDGPLETKPLVIGGTGDVVGEVLIWVRGGRLSLLEQAWFTDSPPTEWPQPEQVRIK